jgi:hypothetical protein
MPLMLPVDLASAGAITSANRIGVSSGTRISRGVWALRANRRRDSVTKTPAVDTAGARRRGLERVLGGLMVTADMFDSPFAGRDQPARLRR